MHSSIFHMSYRNSIGIGLVALIGDYVISQESINHDIRAVVDNLTHGFIGVITWLAVTANFPNLSDTSRLIEVALCGLLASAIDLDHFIAAKSLKIQDARSLSSRPFLHCTSYPVVVILLFSSVAYHLQWTNFQRVLWILLAAFLSHHIRDATRQGFWLCPFGSTPPIPYAVYILANMALPHALDQLIRYTTNIPRGVSLSDVISI